MSGYPANLIREREKSSNVPERAAQVERRSIKVVLRKPINQRISKVLEFKSFTKGNIILTNLDVE